MSCAFAPGRVGIRALTDNLLELTADVAATYLNPPPLPMQDADAVVSHIEINDHHGVGVLVQRLFGRHSNILSIRSQDFYAGRQEFGTQHLRVSHGATNRDTVFRTVLEALDGATIKRVVCIPYFADDARTGIALKHIFGAPLCTYIMDDQNLATDGIPDAIMAELLELSSLRLAISPELQAGYRTKFDRDVWFLPPVVPSELIPRKLIPPPGEAAEQPSGVMIGNIWGKRWIDLLRDTVRGSRLTVRWYNNGDFRWKHGTTLADLAADGILAQEGHRHSDVELVDILRQSAFVVVPSGVLDNTDDKRAIAQLSLPSRIPYLFATSHIPILVLGSAETAAARFVVDTGIGTVAPYDRSAFQAAVRYLADPMNNARMRSAAFGLSDRFTDDGTADWIWESMIAGGPIDRRYEDILTMNRGK